MATKFTSDEAKIFNSFIKGKTKDEIIKERIEMLDDRFEKNLTEEERKANNWRIENRKRNDLKEIDEVETFFKKLKPFEKEERYALNHWGYEQTNLDNISVIGKVGACVVAILDKGYMCEVFTVLTKKYNAKEKYTYIDNNKILSTSWKEPYSEEEQSENSHYNAYYGH